MRLDCETWTEAVTVRDYACSDGSEAKRFSCTQTYVSGIFPTISTTCNCGFWGASGPYGCF